MILIPGVAVCWNLLPKQQNVLPSLVFETLEEPAVTAEPEEIISSDPAPPINMEPPIVQALPLQPTAELNPTASVAPFRAAAASSETIKAMNWNNGDKTMTVPIPTVVAEEVAAPPAIPAGRKTDLSPQQYFPQLESELQSLGVKYYRLQKWGTNGELVRVSCYVALAEPYHCQKYFQDIDRDEIRVMERVISQIKAWRK